jgi:DNA-directed RNA polymerase subunit L
LDGGTTPGPSNPTIKTRRVVEPSRLVLKTYLETLEDVNAFLDRLRAEIEDAIHKGERIQVQ